MSTEPRIISSLLHWGRLREPRAHLSPAGGSLLHWGRLREPRAHLSPAGGETKRGGRSVKEQQGRQVNRPLRSLLSGDQQTKERSRALRKNATDAELILWHHIRRRQLNGHRFRRQQPIGPYIVDFFCYESRLIVEVDGGQHSVRKEHDDERTLWLEQKGFQVLRVLES